MTTIPCTKCNAQARKIADGPYVALYRCFTCRQLVEVPHEPGVQYIRFACFDHQGKSNKLIDALSKKYERCDTRENPYFTLSDSDVSARAMQMKKMQSRGCKRFFVYPHAARPSMINAQYPTWDGTTAQFVVNKYHAEVLQTYGYEKPLIETGWYLSPVGQFKPRNTNGRAVNVLFAPIHPRNAEIDRTVNKATFDRLIACVQSGDVNLTVRHIGEIQESGLDYIGGVNYTRGEMNQATEQMDSADVVIGHQTFAWLAVARGIPCVMFAEDMPTHFRANNKYYDVPQWDKVHHLFRYPLDILCENDTIGLLRRATLSDSEIADWRRRMIGEVFDPDKFREKVEAYL